MSSWIDISEASGAISATLAFVGGLAISFRYGRKANAEIAGSAYENAGKVTVATRLSISAVGLYRITFSKENGVHIRLTEVVQGPTDTHDGRSWLQGSPFGTSFVEAGETLTSTVIFPLGESQADVIGWRVSFGFTVERRPAMRRLLWSWADTAFIPSSQFKD
jgi:hypothetical protein